MVPEVDFNNTKGSECNLGRIVSLFVEHSTTQTWYSSRTLHYSHSNLSSHIEPIVTDSLHRMRCFHALLILQILLEFAPNVKFSVMSSYLAMIHGGITNIIKRL
jgi:hypothetical protein